MNEKTNMKSGFYYREPGKHVMGPLPLGTLQVASQSGSLNENAEVSRDGNEPWILLSVVLENRDKAFTKPRVSAKESKGMSPIIVAAMVVAALGAGAFAMNYFGQLRHSEGNDSTSSDSAGPKENAAAFKEIEKLVKLKASNFLSSAQFVIISNDKVEAAKVELSEQRSAGRSQLKAIEFQEAKTDREKTVKEYERRSDDLFLLEEKAGMADHYSKPIREFFNYVECLAIRTECTKKYGSTLDPKYAAQCRELRHLMFEIELDEVLDGGYKNGFGASNR